LLNLCDRDFSIPRFGAKMLNLHEASRRVSVDFLTGKPEPAPTRRPGLFSRSALWRDAAEIVVLVATIYTFVNLTTARAVVEGASMQPNFDTGQLVIVNRFVYFFDNPARGDVVVLHNPDRASEDLIKRVIGLPGETIQIKEGRVYINNTLLDEPYIVHFCTACRDETWTLGANQYFVLGDNRSNSRDSHSFGPVNRALIVGKAWIRYWPLPEFAVIEHPRYGPINHTYVAPPMTPTRTPAPVTPAPPHVPGSSNLAENNPVSLLPAAG
jgi:signal peptidase I